MVSFFSLKVYYSESQNKTFQKERGTLAQLSGLVPSPRVEKNLQKEDLVFL